MSFFCPNNTCIYFKNPVSRREAQEFRGYCQSSVCNTLLQKAAVVASQPQPKKKSASSSYRRLSPSTFVDFVPQQVAQPERPERIFYGPECAPLYKAALCVELVPTVVPVDLDKVQEQQLAAAIADAHIASKREARIAALAVRRAILRRQARKLELLAQQKAKKEIRTQRIQCRKKSALKTVLSIRTKRAMAAKKAAARAELEARRAAGLTRKAALRRQLKKQALRKPIGRKVPQTSRPENFSGLVSFLRSFDLIVEVTSSPQLPVFQEVCPHPIGEDLAIGPNDYVPIVGYIKSLPFMGRIVEATNKLLPFLEVTEPLAAADLRTYVHELASLHSSHYRRQKFMATILEWLALCMPLCPIRGMLDSYFPLSLIPDIEEKPLIKSLRDTAVMILKFHDGPVDAHSIFEKLGSLARKIGACKDFCIDYAKEKCQNVLESILASVKKTFFSILSPYMAAVQRVKDEIENFWQSCVVWAKKLWMGTHIALQALGAYAIWAIISIIVVGIMYMIEAIFIALGLLSQHGMLVVAITGAVFACLGFTVFNMGREYVHFLHSLRQLVFLAVLPDGSVNPLATYTEEETHVSTGPGDGVPHASDFVHPHSLLDTVMVPINFLESIASGLTFFSSSSITVLGKLGNSLEGIRKGFNCLRDFTATLLDSFGGAFEYISGKRTSFFRNLSCAVKVNIDKWVTDSRKYIEYFEIAGNLDKFEYYRVRELIYQGEDMMDVANKSRASHTATKFLRTVGKLVDQLKEIRAKCARSLKFPGWRRQPFWFYAYGASQCGKSTLANYIMPELMTHMGWDPQDVYSKDPVDGYWSGYFQQKGLKINDLSAVNSKSTACLEQQLIPLISTEEKMVSSAEIEGKGVQFQSEIVVSSSNVADAPTGAEVLDADAYRLRRKVVLECRRAVEWVHNADGTRKERIDEEGRVVMKPYDPTNALACTEVRWVSNISFTPLNDSSGSWHLAEYTIPMVKVAMQAHFATEDAKLEAWRDKLGMKSTTAKHMSTYLQDLVKGLGVHQGKSLRVAIDGKAYDLQPTGVIVPCSDCDNIEEVERMTLMFYRTTFSTTMLEHLEGGYNDAIHVSMVKDFITEMLESGATILSVDKLSSSTPDMHLELWKELGLAERFFLRVSQVALNQIRDAPHFKENITNVYLESMRIARDIIVDNKEKILLFFCAVALVGIFSWGFFSLLKSLVGGSLGAGATLAVKEQLAHTSVMSSGSATSAFAARNIPVVWAKGARLTTAHSNKEDVPQEDYFSKYNAHLVARIVGTSGQSETCLLFAHQAIALCAHQLRMFPDNDRVIIHYFTKDKTPACFSFTWHWVNAVEWPDNEVIVYKDPQLTALPVYSDSLYFRGDVKYPTVLNVKGISIKKKKFFEADTLTSAEQMLDGETPILRTWSDVASLCTSIQTISGPNYRRDINRYYTSAYPSGVHDSGGIITASIGGVQKVIGLHCAGKKEGYYFKSTIGLLPTGDLSIAHSAPDYFVPSTGREEKSFCKIGWIKDFSKRPHTGTKTAMVPVPKEIALPVPEGVVPKIPSILSKQDPRLKDEVNPEYRNYDPLYDGMDKFANAMDYLEDDVLERVCEDIYQTWYDALPEFEGQKQYLEKVSMEVALNGIPGEACYEAMRLDTSEGYPYVCERKPGETGKGRYVLVSEDGSRTLIEGTTVHRDYLELSQSVFKQVPVLNCVECPKDELLKPSKVLEKPGTRLFDTLPFVHNILLREYFLNFCVFLQHNRLRLPCSVGINPYSREWTWLYDRLASKSDQALNCDYSKFDGLISPQVYLAMVRTINRLFKDGPEADRARINLFTMFTGRRSIAYDQVYMVRGGMPSGCALTVVINSILNEILIRYVYRTTVPMPARNYFNKYVELIVYGDDNLIAIHEDVLEWFDGPVIKQTLGKVGVTITDGSDKSSPTLNRKPLGSLDFLKRGFRKIEGGLMACPLDKSSLYSRLYYTTAGPNGCYQMDILHDNIKSFLEELIHHENHYEEFCRIRDFYVNRVPSWSSTLPTYVACLDMMEGQRTQSTPWQPHRFIETRPTGVEEKMMAGQDNYAQCIYITSRLSVCGVKYTPPVKETSFVVSIDTPLFLGERGITVRNDFDRGTGQLPTNAWVRAFASPKKYKELHDAYDNGATIYFRSRMPYYNGWCAVCGFARSKGIDVSSIIALYETYKPKHAGDIAPIVAENSYKRVLERPRFHFASLKEKVVEAHGSAKS